MNIGPEAKELKCNLF